MRYNNRKLTKKFYVSDSEIHGRGLFAKAKFKKGQYLGTYEGPNTANNGMHVLWIRSDAGRWRRRDGKNWLRFINHSGEPNAEFDGFDLFATRPIAPREEIKIDYGEDPA